jgi:hypothetical protein
MSAIYFLVWCFISEYIIESSDSKINIALVEPLDNNIVVGAKKISDIKKYSIGAGTAGV